MARGAQRSREARGDVIRYASAKGRRALPGGYVATVAIRVRRREVVVVSDVAVRASNDFACGLKLMRTR